VRHQIVTYRHVLKMEIEAQSQKDACVEHTFMRSGVVVVPEADLHPASAIDSLLGGVGDDISRVQYVGSGSPLFEASSRQHVCTSAMEEQEVIVIEDDLSQNDIEENEDVIVIDSDSEEEGILQTQDQNSLSTVEGNSWSRSEAQCVEASSEREGELVLPMDTQEVAEEKRVIESDPERCHPGSDSSHDTVEMTQMAASRSVVGKNKRKACDDGVSQTPTTGANVQNEKPTLSKFQINSPTTDSFTTTTTPSSSSNKRMKGDNGISQTTMMGTNAQTKKKPTQTNCDSKSITTSHLPPQSSTSSTGPPLRHPPSCTAASSSERSEGLHLMPEDVPLFPPPHSTTISSSHDSSSFSGTYSHPPRRQCTPVLASRFVFQRGRPGKEEKYRRLSGVADDGGNNWTFVGCDDAVSHSQKGVVMLDGVGEGGALSGHLARLIAAEADELAERKERRREKREEAMKHQEHMQGHHCEKRQQQHSSHNGDHCHAHHQHGGHSSHNGDHRHAHHQHGGHYSHNGDHRHSHHQHGVHDHSHQPHHSTITAPRSGGGGVGWENRSKELLERAHREAAKKFEIDYRTMPALVRSSVNVRPSATCAALTLLMKQGENMKHREKGSGGAGIGSGGTGGEGAVEGGKIPVLHSLVYGDCQVAILRKHRNSSSINTDCSSTYEVIFLSSPRYAGYKNRVPIPIQIDTSAHSLRRGEAGEMQVEEGDVVVVGTDGFFDNLHGGFGFKGEVEREKEIAKRLSSVCNVVANEVRKKISTSNNERSSNTSNTSNPTDSPSLEDEDAAQLQQWRQHSELTVALGRALARYASSTMDGLAGKRDDLTVFVAFISLHPYTEASSSLMPSSSFAPSSAEAGEEQGKSLARGREEHCLL